MQLSIFTLTHRADANGHVYTEVFNRESRAYEGFDLKRAQLSGVAHDTVGADGKASYFEDGAFVIVAKH